MHAGGVLYRTAWEVRVCPALHPNGSDDDDGVGGRLLPVMVVTRTPAAVTMSLAIS